MLKIKTFVVGPIETNSYIAYDANTKEGILIDPAEYDDNIKSFIEDECIDIKYIVNTHGHYDHIGANADFGYPVIIHKDDAQCLKDGMRSLTFFSGKKIAEVTPVKTVDESDIIKVEGLEFKVIDTPGHTPGGMTIECEGVLFTGDTLFKNGVGRTDLPFGDHSKLIGSIKKLLKYPDDTVFYPGHGQSSTIGAEKNTEI